MTSAAGLRSDWGLLRIEAGNLSCDVVDSRPDAAVAPEEDSVVVVVAYFQVKGILPLRFRMLHKNLYFDADYFEWNCVSSDC